MKPASVWLIGKATRRLYDRQFTGCRPPGSFEKFDFNEDTGTQNLVLILPEEYNLPPGAAPGPAGRGAASGAFRTDDTGGRVRGPLGTWKGGEHKTATRRSS